MGKVAVAGGSSGLGRTMVDALEAAKTHNYIILSRKATGPETRAADYSNVNSLTSLLESEQVDTVISMLPIDNDESGQAQLNLIAAAERSTCTKRFLPSEFGMVYTKEYVSCSTFARYMIWLTTYQQHRPCPFLPMEAQSSRRP